MEYNENTILQEIDSDSKALLEELSLYCESDNLKADDNNQQQMNQPKPAENPAADKNNVAKKKSLIFKSNTLLKKMKKNLNDEDYLLNGYQYHSQILYKMCTKFPFLGKTIGVPLMAITKIATNNVIHKKMEQEKILNLYTRMKGDKEAVDTKIKRLEALQKPNRNQKEELMTLKKMSSELGMNLKRLEFNYKLSHMEEKKIRDNFAPKQKNNPTF